MYDFDIKLKSEPSNSFRVAKIMADFDVKPEHCREEIKGVSRCTRASAPRSTAPLSPSWRSGASSTPATAPVQSAWPPRPPTAPTGW